jgi:hypothetical protein
MAATKASLRKLVLPCYGVLKNRRPFDPEWPSRTSR